MYMSMQPARNMRSKHRMYFIACYMQLHAGRIGMRVLNLNNEPWAWPQVQANASMISIKHASRLQYKMSICEESSIKLTKNASILHKPEKIERLAP
jgi:hypothetical protein